MGLEIFESVSRGSRRFEKFSNGLTFVEEEEKNKKKKMQAAAEAEREEGEVGEEEMVPEVVASESEVPVGEGSGAGEGGAAGAAGAVGATAGAGPEEEGHSVLGWQYAGLPCTACSKRGAKCIPAYGSKMAACAGCVIRRVNSCDGGKWICLYMCFFVIDAVCRS